MATRRCRTATVVQSLIFARRTFTPAEAKAWARSHGFRYGKVDVKANTLRLRQFPPAQCCASGGTIRLRPGVQAYVCRPPGGGLDGLGGDGPRRPTKAQLDKLVRAYAEWRAAWRGAPLRIEQKMHARYEAALRPILARLQATALSDDNQRALERAADRYAASHLIGPGVSW